MTYEDREKPEFFLWRIMVDSEHQGRGYAREALELLVERLRSIPQARELTTCHVRGEGGPGGFYQKLGFTYTGGKIGQEPEMKLELGPPDS